MNSTVNNLTWRIWDVAEGRAKKNYTRVPKKKHFYGTLEHFFDALTTGDLFKQTVHATFSIGTSTVSHELKLNLLLITSIVFQLVRLINGQFNISCDVLVNPPVPDHNITWDFVHQGKPGKITMTTKCKITTYVGFRTSRLAWQYNDHNKVKKSQHIEPVRIGKRNRIFQRENPEGFGQCEHAACGISYIKAA